MSIRSTLQPFWRTLLPFGACLVIFTGGCDREKDPPPAAKKAQEQDGKAPEKQEPPKPLALGHRFPVGPRLVFLPGEGVSAIRFGATVQTIERHMEAPCDKKTEERCLYVRAAVEFFLEDGVLARIKAHRRDRKVDDPPAEGDQYFGSLRGIVRPKIMLGLHQHVVLEEFGEPKRKETISPPGSDGLVARHYYDGINLEYDKIENGNTVLSGIEIYPSDSPHEPPRPAGELIPPKRRPAPAGPLPDSERAR